jgi:hypothetical protein
LNRIKLFNKNTRPTVSPYIGHIAEAGIRACSRKPEIQRYIPKGLYLFLLSDFGNLATGER